MGRDELREVAQQTQAPSPHQAPRQALPKPSLDRPHSRPAARWFAWLCVVLWIGMIFSLGGGSFSNSETSRFLGPLLHWLFPDAGGDLLERAQFVIRKGAHVVEYGVLALLCVRAWWLSHGWPRFRTALASLAIVVSVATIDELRQAQLANRMGAIADVALDTFGGAFALLGARAAMRWIPWLR